MGASRFMRGIVGMAALCTAALYGVSSVQAKEADPAYAKQQQETIGQMKGKLAKSAEGKIKNVDVQNCYSCHKDIKEFHQGNKHASVNCAYCHTNADDHAKDGKAPITTKTDPATCGTCHAEQFNSYAAMNYESLAKREKATPRGVSPMFDKLIAGHGFAKEHDQPRSHVFMLMDHLIVDRAYGGRFQPKDWTYLTDAKSNANGQIWDVVLKDKEPSSDEQKAFMPQVATAANPVCLNCKTQDHILKWKYMGDPDPKAKWSRTSKVVDFARDLKHSLNCFMCHDPHSSAPRVVRDALINAVVDRGLGTYPYDKAKSEKTKMTKVEFRNGFRAIGLLSRPDANVMCAQCHVEYNCNPGYDTTNPDTSKYTVTMGDRRTNHFFWSDVFHYKEEAAKINFKDFKHATTGALLSKMQHPEAETFWGSKHEREGVECKDCHMRKIEKNGKTVTDHQQRSPRSMLQETCVKCHGEMTVENAKFQIDSIQNYIRGKVTKAEYWLAQFIDTFAKAKTAGVGEDVLNQARAKHDSAHIYWEWWTAENSVGFHNPAAARESLTRSVDESQAGIKLLNDAIAALKK